MKARWWISMCPYCLAGHLSGGPKNMNQPPEGPIRCHHSKGPVEMTGPVEVVPLDPGPRRPPPDRLVRLDDGPSWALLAVLMTVSVILFVVIALSGPGIP